MNDQIKIIVNYFRLKRYLMDELEYSNHAAISAIGNIRKMDKDVRKAFLVWFTSGKLPEGDFHGIDIQNLIFYREMNPVAAFLAVDWYIKEPDLAYSVLAMPLKDRGNDFTDVVESEDESIDENTEDISE